MAALLEYIDLNDKVELAVVYSGLLQSHWACGSKHCSSVVSLFYSTDGTGCLPVLTRPAKKSPIRQLKVLLSFLQNTSQTYDSQSEILE